MRVAGGRPDIFSPRAIRRLYRLSHGVPRLINVIADRALLAAYARDENRIGAGLVGKAADEVFGRQGMLRWWPWTAAVLSIALMLAVGPARHAVEPAKEPEPATSPAVIATDRPDDPADEPVAADDAVPFDDPVPVDEPSLTEVLAASSTSASCRTIAT